MNAIEIRDLCKRYDGFFLDHVNLTLPAGCIMGLVGENGAGKSTLIKLILNMIRRDGGTVSCSGKAIRNISSWRKRISAWFWMRWGFLNA